MGAPASGKTPLAASAAEVEDMAPVAFLDLDPDGAASAEQYNDGQRMAIFPLQNNAAAVFDALETLRAGRHPYRTVVIDPITRMAGAALLAAAELSGSRPRGAADASQSIPGPQEYGRVGSMIERVVAGFLALDMHVIMVAHSMLKEGSDARQRVALSFHSSLRAAVPGYFAQVLYLHQKRTLTVERNQQVTKIRRELLCAPGTAEGDVDARDRRQKLPDVLVEPTMKQIWEIMYAHDDKEHA